MQSARRAVLCGCRHLAHIAHVPQRQQLLQGQGRVGGVAAAAVAATVPWKQVAVMATSSSSSPAAGSRSSPRRSQPARAASAPASSATPSSSLSDDDFVAARGDGGDDGIDATPTAAAKRLKGAGGGAVARSATVVADADDGAAAGGAGTKRAASSPGATPGGSKRASLAPSPHAGPAEFELGASTPAASLDACTAGVPPRRPGRFKIISANVNGLRAWLAPDKLPAIRRWLAAEDPDVLCLQETKIDDSLVDGMRMLLPTLPHSRFSCCTRKKGYAGTAVYSKTPLRVISKSVHAEDGLAAGERQGLDEEGRVLAVEVGGIKLVNVYTPNSGQGLVRLASRTTAWDPAFRRTVVDLAAGAAGAAAPVVVMGDLNVALRDMDIHNPKANRNKSAGFCDAERDGMADLLAAGFTDVWAAKYPTTAQYTYWGVRPFGLRAENKGWRLDYVLTSGAIDLATADMEVRHTWPFNDHVPIVFEFVPPAPAPAAPAASPAPVAAAAAAAASADAPT